MGKTCVQKKLFLICSILAVMAAPTKERIFPLEVTNIVTVLSQQDPVALYLRDNRWACAGDGCLSDGAIGRFARNLRAMSSKHDIPVAMLVGVVMVENPWLDSLVISPAGAIGLLQVMPMHREAWRQCVEPMESIVGSTCRGSAILADFIGRRGSEWSALLGYNGCKGGPCESYPVKVSEHSSRFVSTQSDD